MKTNRLLLEFLALISILPILRANLHTLVCVFVFFVWFIYSVSQTSLKFVIKDPWGVSTWWIILIIYEFFLSVIGFSSTEPNNFLTRIPVYFIPVVMTFVLRKYSYNDQKHLFIFIIIIIVSTILQNSFLHLRNPSFFNGFSLKEDIYRLTNWGTSGFVGCALFMVPSCFLIYQKKNSGFIRWIALLGLVLPFFYITIINTRNTAFILLLFYIVALVYVRRVKINDRVLFVILTTIVFVVGMALVLPLVNWLASILGSEKLVNGLNSISLSLQNSQIEEYEGSSLYGRFFLMQVSLGTWTQSFFTFLFGIGEDALDANSLGFISDLEALGIGQHSQIIDFLAMYGIVGTSMLLKAFHATFSCIRTFAVNKSMLRELNVVFIGYLLMSVLNNTLYTNELLVMFVLFAISVNIYSQKTVESNSRI